MQRDNRPLAWYGACLSHVPYGQLVLYLLCPLSTHVGYLRSLGSCLDAINVLIAFDNLTRNHWSLMLGF